MRKLPRLVDVSPIHGFPHGYNGFVKTNLKERLTYDHGQQWLISRPFKEIERLYLDLRYYRRHKVDGRRRRGHTHGLTEGKQIRGATPTWTERDEAKYKSLMGLLNIEIRRRKLTLHPSIADL